MRPCPHVGQGARASFRAPETALDENLPDGCVVELKAVESILPIHRAQLLSYLKAGGFRLGLLINFNVPRLRDGVSRTILSDPLRSVEIRE